jgi:hypothetical protein
METVSPWLEQTSAAGSPERGLFASPGDAWRLHDANETEGNKMETNETLQIHADHGGHDD